MKCFHICSPKQERPTTEQFLLHPASRTDFTEVVEFLSDFTLKTEEDRALFCKLVFGMVLQCVLYRCSC